MKLYTRKQVVFRSLVSAALAAALVSIIFTTRPSREAAPDPSQSAAQSEERAPAAAGGEDFRLIENTSPVLPVADEDTSYTQDEAQNIAVYEMCNEAVVNITTQVMGYNWFYEPIVTESGTGSGSIIDKRGYVVTNVHVIENASVINISLADGSTYEGSVVGQDTESDIAVLKFDPEGKDLKTIAFGSSDNLRVGQRVIAIGNPFALERTMTTGIISALGRPVQESEDVIIRNMIQTDAAINPGNSGGPLLDAQGRMIGINTMIMSRSGSSSGVGFAVPVSTARRVVSDLLRYGHVNRGVMRLSLVQNTRQIARYAGYSTSSGMIISRVQSGSKAEEAGLRGGTRAVQYGRFNPQTIYLGGDVITAIDDIDVATLADYYSAIEDKAPGDTVTVTVLRGRDYVRIPVELDSPSE